MHKGCSSPVLFTADGRISINARHIYGSLFDQAAGKYTWNVSSPER